MHTPPAFSYKLSAAVPRPRPSSQQRGLRRPNGAAATPRLVSRRVRASRSRTSPLNGIKGPLFVRESFCSDASGGFCIGRAGSRWRRCTRWVLYLPAAVCLLTYTYRASLSFSTHRTRLAGFLGRRATRDRRRCLRHRRRRGCSSFYDLVSSIIHVKGVARPWMGESGRRTVPFPHTSISTDTPRIEVRKYECEY